MKDFLVTDGEGKYIDEHGRKMHEKRKFMTRRQAIYLGQKHSFYVLYAPSNGKSCTLADPQFPCPVTCQEWSKRMTIKELMVVVKKRRAGTRFDALLQNVNSKTRKPKIIEALQASEKR